MNVTIANNWSAIVAEAIEFRRMLHRHPELAWFEHETAGRIRLNLDQHAIPWRACAKTGTVATLAPEAPGRHIALRGDIDALPIVEASGVEWSSAIEGRMHACGHDGHTATLMAAACWLKAHEAQLPGPVTLLFQPAEEGGHGAKAMIEDGALEGVEAIFGWHNWPAIPFGKAACPNGAVMAGNGSFEITIRGQGGHASQPELCRDPLLAASTMVTALQQIVSRRISPQAATVLSVTSLHADGGSPTVTPSTASLGGSFRLGDPATRGLMGELIDDIARNVAAAHGVNVDVSIHPRYGTTVNHRQEAEVYRRVLLAELGDHALDSGLKMPIMASEDFSYYLDEIPGAFALIGADDGLGNHNPCHSPEYDFNDRLIDRVGRVYARIAGIPVKG